MMSARALSLIVAGLLSVVTAVGQPTGDPASDVRYWAHVGPDLTTLGGGVSGGLAVEFERHVLSFRATSTDPSPGAETWDVALLYGRAMAVRSFVLSGGTGVSIVGGTRYESLFGRGPGEPLETMIGFPLEGQVAWTPTRLVSIGVRGFANVNTGQPFGGMGVVVRVGNLR